MPDYAESISSKFLTFKLEYKLITNSSWSILTLIWIGSASSLLY